MPITSLISIVLVLMFMIHPCVDHLLLTFIYVNECTLNKRLRKMIEALDVGKQNDKQTIPPECKNNEISHQHNLTQNIIHRQSIIPRLNFTGYRITLERNRANGKVMLDC